MDLQEVVVPLRGVVVARRRPRRPLERIARQRVHGELGGGQPHGGGVAGVRGVRGAGRGARAPPVAVAVAGDAGDG